MRLKLFRNICFFIKLNLLLKFFNILVFCFVLFSSSSDIKVSLRFKSKSSIILSNDSFKSFLAILAKFSVGDLKLVNHLRSRLIQNLFCHQLINVENTLVNLDKAYLLNYCLYKYLLFLFDYVDIKNRL